MVPRPDRLALQPVRYVARSGRGILAAEAERALESLLAGTLPEAFGRTLAEHEVIERVASGLLEDEGERDHLEQLIDHVLHSPALERWVQSGEAGRLLAPIAAEALRNPELRASMMDLVASAEIRGEIGRQTVAANDALFHRVRVRLRVLFHRQRPELPETVDEALDASIHRVLGHAAPAPSPRQLR